MDIDSYDENTERRSSEASERLLYDLIEEKGALLRGMIEGKLVIESIQRSTNAWTRKRGEDRRGGLQSVQHVCPSLVMSRVLQLSRQSVETVHKLRIKHGGFVRLWRWVPFPFVELLW